MSVNKDLYTHIYENNCLMTLLYSGVFGVWRIYKQTKCSQTATRDDDFSPYFGIKAVAELDAIITVLEIASFLKYSYDLFICSIR